jgi:hypothetical protein
MAIHNAVLLANENKELRIANERQKKKQEKVRSYIAEGGVLTVEEGMQKADNKAKERERRNSHADASIKPRAIRHCSICSSTEHTARTCPQK